MREHGIWRVSLGESEKSERGACGEEESANFPERELVLKERGWVEWVGTFSTRPRSCF